MHKRRPHTFLEAGKGVINHLSSSPDPLVPTPVFLPIGTYAVTVRIILLQVTFAKLQISVALAAEYRDVLQT